jgi:hypothetical protein
MFLEKLQGCFHIGEMDGVVDKRKYYQGQANAISSLENQVCMGQPKQSQPDHPLVK